MPLLKAECEFLGLKKGGAKDELRRRIDELGPPLPSAAEATPGGGGGVDIGDRGGMEVEDEPPPSSAAEEAAAAAKAELRSLGSLAPEVERGVLGAAPGEGEAAAVGQYAAELLGLLGEVEALHTSTLEQELDEAKNEAALGHGTAAAAQRAIEVKTTAALPAGHVAPSMLQQGTHSSSGDANRMVLASAQRLEVPPVAAAGGDDSMQPERDSEAAQLVVELVALNAEVEAQQQNIDELRARPDGAADGGYRMQVEEEVPPAAPAATPAEGVGGGGVVGGDSSMEVDAAPPPATEAMEADDAERRAMVLATWYSRRDALTGRRLKVQRQPAAVSDFPRNRPHLPPPQVFYQEDEEIPVPYDGFVEKVDRTKGLWVKFDGYESVTAEDEYDGHEWVTAEDEYECTPPPRPSAQLPPSTRGPSSPQPRVSDASVLPRTRRASGTRRRRRGDRRGQRRW